MKKNIIGRMIEAILLLAGILLTAAIVVTISLNSYNEHKAYRDKLIELSKPEPKPVLESLTVQLKEGVTLYLFLWRKRRRHIDDGRNERGA
jgi:hypothetical protein